MGLFSQGNNKEFSGMNIYKDTKNRTIYYNRFTKKAYVLKPENFDSYKKYSTRFSLPVIIFMLLSGFVFNSSKVQFEYATALAFGLAFVVYLVIALRFYLSFLPALTILPKFEPEKKLSRIVAMRKTPLGLSIVKTIIIVALGSLLVVNGHMMFANNGDKLTLYLNYILAIVCASIAIMNIYAMCTRSKEVTETKPKKK